MLNIMRPKAFSYGKMTAFDLKTELVATFAEAKHLLDPQTVESLSDMACAIRDSIRFLIPGVRWSDISEKHDCDVDVLSASAVREQIEKLRDSIFSAHSAIVN